MRLNEFKNNKKQPIDEALSDWFGDLGAAKIKGGLDTLRGMSGGSAGTAERVAREKFVNNFVGKTAFNLRDLIKSGVVSTKAATPSTPPAASRAKAKVAVPAPSSQPAPTAASAPPAPAPTTPGVPAPASQSTVAQTPAQASSNVQPSVKYNVPLANKPNMATMPTTGATSKPATAGQTSPTPAGPGKVSGGAGPMAFSSMASSLQGINPNIQSNPATSSISSTGGRTTKIPAQKTTDTTKHVSSPVRNVTQQLAKTMPKPATPGQSPRVWHSNRLKENQYIKLNNVFEGLLSINEAQAMSIGQWLNQTVNTYMKGFNLRQYKGGIDKAIQEIEKAYASSDNIAKQEKAAKEGFRNLGNLLYTIFQTEKQKEPKSKAPQVPAAQAGASATTTKTQATPPVTSSTTTASGNSTPYKQIVNLLPNLKPQDKQRLLTKLSKP